MFFLRKLYSKPTARRSALLHRRRITPAIMLLSLPVLLLASLPAQEPVQLDCKELQESSGVAVSGYDPDLIWTHNDSGGTPRIYLFNRQTGKLRGTCELTDVANVDWEDMCSFMVGDQSFLAIADVGDNSRGRRSVEICIVKEPKPTGKGSDPNDVDKIKKITRLEVRYPKGSFDCESLAYDPSHSRFILLTKEPVACRLFSVPVEPKLFTDFEDRTAKITAEYLQGFSLSLVTGADICPETRRLVVCNYGIGFIAQPSVDQPLLWDRNSLVKIALPKRKQGEAVAFLNPKQLITTSEFAPTPLWTTDLPKPQQSPTRN
jgi:hypothetical protein